MKLRNEARSRASDSDIRPMVEKRVEPKGVLDFFLERWLREGNVEYQDGIGRILMAFGTS
jgi:hypothetical protein